MLPVHGRYTSMCNGSRSVGSVEHAHLLLETLVQGRYVVCACGSSCLLLAGADCEVCKGVFIVCVCLYVCDCCVFVGEYTTLSFVQMYV